LKIKFHYQQRPPCKAREFIINSLASAISELIELPESIEICLYNLDKNMFGGIDRYIHNRIGINYSLELIDIPRILAHELLHMHQMHTGLLCIKNDIYYWQGIPYHNVNKEESYQSYKSSPWETDVDTRVDKLLIDAIELTKKKQSAKFDNKST
jgi:uncharacterized protein YjaZ